MRPILIIARLTMIETIRRQIELLTFFLAIGISLLPRAANVFSLGGSERVVKDVALTIIGYYVIALAVFFGSVALPSEVERKTLYPLITKPMPRRAYLWGKWLGLMGFIAFSLILLSGTLAASMWIEMGFFDPSLTKVVAGYMLEGGVLTALCIMFSTFSSPPLAAVLALFVYIMGGLPTVFIEFFLRQSALQLFVAKTVKMMLPHFEYFHVKDAVVHGDPVANSYMLAIMAYAVVWIVFIQLIAETTFERKDL